MTRFTPEGVMTPTAATGPPTRVPDPQAPLLVDLSVCGLASCRHQIDTTACMWIVQQRFFCSEVCAKAAAKKM